MKTACCLALLLSTLVSGLNWSDSGDVRWSLNCDFAGNDLANVGSKGEDCGGKCMENSACTHFTWSNYQGGTCWLKQGDAGEGNAQEKSDDGAVCGFVKSRNGGSGGNNGGNGGNSGDGTCQSSSSQNCVQFVNNCPYPVWVGILGKPEIPEGGGFQLDQNQQKNAYFSAEWEGRMWGRTGCDGSGHCETGDCGNKIQCNGAGGVPPVTLAEIKFRGAGLQDFYDVSLVDGFNLPMRFGPIQGTTGDAASGYTCTEANCLANINDGCPDQFAVKNGQGATVSCKSACLAFGNPEYCCTGEFGSPEACKATTYAKEVKAKCPLAYSYAYDDVKSTFTCRGSQAPSAAYRISFC